MKILAVDISSVFRRAWEAGHDDAYSVARTRAVSKILDAASGFDRVVIARDPPVALNDKTPCAPFRRALFHGYKAGRADPGEAYRDQLGKTVEELRSRGATSFVSPRMGDAGDVALFGEADDVLSSLAMWYEEKRGEDWRLRILSGDTDLWAIVDDSIGIDVVDLDGRVITTDAVVERFGVAPHLIPELKALCGDSSDKYKPFEHPEKDAKGNAKAGIGESTAADIVLADAGRQDGDKSGADGVLRAVLSGTDPGCKLNAPVVLCLKHHGAGGLDLGRKLAYMRPDLKIDFSSILDEPKLRPMKPAAPTVAIAEEPPAASKAMVVAAPSAPMAQYDPRSLEPPDMGSAMQCAEWMHNSGLFRKNLASPAACLMVIGIARSLGVPIFLAAQHAFMVHGRLSWSAVFQLALVRQHPETRRFQFNHARCDKTQAVVEFERSGKHAIKGEYPFTIQDAREAGFLDGKHSEQWKLRPSVMLRWAAARECARIFWGDALWGMHGADEVDHGGMTDNPGEFPSGMVTEET